MVECFKQSYRDLLIHEKIQLSLLHESSKLDKMTSTCVACKETVSRSVHICTNLKFPENNGLIYASTSFEKRFDLVLCTDSLMGVKNTVLDEENEALFFLHTTTNDCKSSNQPCGKDINSLRIEAVQGLTTMMNSFVKKADQHRPGSDTIRANKVRMYLSRINQPFKKCNNDKGVVKLQNHSNALFTLGNDWIKDYVHIELFTTDVTDHRGISYIEKSKDY